MGVRFAIGMAIPRSRHLIRTGSSIQAPNACPVNPFVFNIRISLNLSPKVLRSDSTSAAEEPPLAGVYVSCDMKSISDAITFLSRPCSFSIFLMKLSIDRAIWATSNLEP